MSHGMDKYLCCTTMIDSEHYSIRQKAQDLTEDQGNATEKARTLFYFVRDGIKYNPYLFTLLPQQLFASVTLEKREGFCVQKAILLAALARAAGIPARLRFANLRNHLAPRKLLDELLATIHTDVFLWHAYNELYIHGKWLKVTSAFDIEMCKENRIIPVEFDGKKDAAFHSHTLDGRLHIEYVEDHGHYEDVPLDKIVEAYKRSKGET
jgi:transglutaminase-like putative cysteine protease